MAQSTASKIVVLGAGGHAREVLDVIEAINASQLTWVMAGFLDNAPEHLDRIKRRGVGVLGPTSPDALPPASFTIGIGSGSIRATLDEQFARAGWTAATLIHPLASVGSDNRLGRGTLLAAGARVTTNVELGRHVHLNVNAVVSHDCIVDDYVTLSPGVMLNGSITVGAGAFFGTGAIVTPGINIGAGATVGAGAVVIRDVGPGETVFGVPATSRSQ